MATHSFDDFLDALRASVAAAQARVAARDAARAASRAAGCGPPRATFRVMLDDLPPHGPAVLEVPLEDLCAGGAPPRLSRFVFEVGVAVEPAAAAGPGRHGAALVLDPVPRPWRRTHRLRVELDGPQPGAGGVYLDGHAIRTFAAAGPAGPDHPGDTRHG